MWIPEPPAQQLLRIRQSLGITQRELARRCGLSATRIAQLETSRRLPTASEVAQLASLDVTLSQREFPLPPPASLLQRFRKDHGHTPVYPVHMRLKRLREKIPIEGLLSKILRRPDAAACRAWLGTLPTESCDELLPWLRLLADADSLPYSLSLSQLHFDAYPVKDLRLPRAALELRLGESVAVLFPQVTIYAIQAYRVDILVEIASGRRRMTKFIEVDGAGHDPSGDHRRDRHLRQTLRFTPIEILRNDWPNRLSELLLQRP